MPHGFLKSFDVVLLRLNQVPLKPLTPVSATLQAVILLAMASQARGAEVDPQTPVLLPSLTYDGTALANLGGGIRAGRAYVGNLHLRLTAKGDSFSLPGTTAFVDVLTVHGGRPSRLVGDAQGTSNIEAPDGTHIEELWLQHNFEGSRASLLAGIYDLGSEFYRLQVAGLFLNSAFGIGTDFGQSGVEGPSTFPRTAAGMRVSLKPAAGVVVRAALMDGVPVVRPDGSRGVFRSGDGILAVTEIALLSRPDAGQTPTRVRDLVGRLSSLSPDERKLAVGGWHYSASYPDLSDVGPDGQPARRQGSSGFYVIGEGQLLGGAAAGSGRVAGFAEAGFADARTNRFSSHFGAGVVGSGWSPMKDTDQVGLSVTQVRNGSHYARSQSSIQQSGTALAETTFELTYLSHVFKSVAIQPDLQYVIHPNATSSLSNAWVVQVRFELAY